MAILEDAPAATVIQADILDVPSALGHPETRRMIDIAKPIGIIMVESLHFVPETVEPAGVGRAR